MVVPHMWRIRMVCYLHAQGVTVEGEAGTQTPRDREGGRLTSPSATPGNT